MAETKTKEDTASGQPVKPTPPVHAKPPTRLLMAEHCTMTWDHTAEPGETFELCKHPGTWKNVLLNLRQGHKIHVHSAEGGWYGELYVRAISRVEINLGVLLYVKFDDGVELADDIPYETKWRGPTAMWSVVLKSNGDVVKDHFQTKEAATTYITGHMHALAA